MICESLGLLQAFVVSSLFAENRFRAMLLGGARAKGSAAVASAIPPLTIEIG